MNKTLPMEYLVYLRGILEGTETDFDEEDEQLAVELEEQLQALDLED